MTLPADTTQPPDICLLLRIHGEQRWLISKVEPLLCQLERPSAIDEDEIVPALAYLEVVWLESGLRAAATDAAFAALDPSDTRCSAILYENACRYHAAVQRLREAIDARVRDLTCLPGIATQEPATS